MGSPFVFYSGKSEIRVCGKRMNGMKPVITKETDAGETLDAYILSEFACHSLNTLSQSFVTGLLHSR